MTYTAGVGLLVAAMAVVTGAVLQILQYRAGRHIITRGQLVTRLLTAGLLLVVIGLIFFGVMYPWPGAVAELGFWTSLTVVAVVVIVLAVLDLRQVDRQKHIRQSELYRAIQELQDSHSQKGKP